MPQFLIAILAITSIGHLGLASETIVAEQRALHGTNSVHLRLTTKDIEPINSEPPKMVSNAILRLEMMVAPTNSNRNPVTNVLWNFTNIAFPSMDEVVGRLSADLSFDAERSAVFMVLHQWHWLSVYRFPVNAREEPTLPTKPTKTRDQEKSEQIPWEKHKITTLPPAIAQKRDRLQLVTIDFVNETELRLRVQNRYDETSGLQYVFAEDKWLVIPKKGAAR